MKKLFFAALLFVFTGLFNSAVAANAPAGTNPEIKFVVTPERIWILADETIYSLPIQIKDANGKVVLEKEFTARCADWSLNLESLPAGSYSVQVKGKEMTTFRK